MKRVVNSIHHVSLTSGSQIFSASGKHLHLTSKSILSDVLKAVPAFTYRQPSLIPSHAQSTDGWEEPLALGGKDAP